MNIYMCVYIYVFIFFTKKKQFQRSVGLEYNEHSTVDPISHIAKLLVSSLRRITQGIERRVTENFQ